MTTTPFEPSDTPAPGPRVEDLGLDDIGGGSGFGEDPDVETPSLPADEDVVPGAAAPEPPD